MTDTERERILEALSREFMMPVFTRAIDWYEIDGTHGITFVPVADVGTTLSDALLEQAPELLQAYYEGTIQSVTRKRGIGARLSAPGYMDCTEWSVFDTLEQAEEYICETYGDDVELDETEES